MIPSTEAHSLMKLDGILRVSLGFDFVVGKPQTPAGECLTNELVVRAGFDLIGQIPSKTLTLSGDKILLTTDRDGSSSIAPRIPEIADINACFFRGVLGVQLRLKPTA